MKDPYVDPDTGVLKNKFGHTDPAVLAEDESEAAYQRVLQLELNPISGSFDFPHLQKIHQFILQDVYSWAGSLRRTDTGAVGMNLMHCRPEHIEDQSAFIFRRMAADKFGDGLPRERAVDRLAYHWGELTVLHPFRDGNSRSQRVFFDGLLKSSGWTIDWRQIDASAVQAARYVAMEATHTPLRDVLMPAVYRSDQQELPTLSASQGTVVHREVAVHHRAMIEHLRTGSGKPYDHEGSSRIASTDRNAAAQQADMPENRHQAPSPREQNHQAEPSADYSAVLGGLQAARSAFPKKTGSMPHRTGGESSSLDPGLDPPSRETGLEL